MNKRNELFKIICANILNEADKFLAQFVYDIICEENYDGLESSENTCSVSSFEATVKDFQRVVNLLNRKTSAQDSFLQNFKKLSEVFKKNNRLLKEYAKPIQTSSTSSDIATISSVVAGGAFFLSFNQLLFPVTALIAVAGGITSALGGGFATSNAILEFRLVKKLLNEAKMLTMLELVAFSAISSWFMYLEELKKSVEVLIDCDVLKEMFQDVMKFFVKLKYQTNIKVGEYKDQLKEMLKFSLRKMNKDGKFKTGNEFTPVAITFVFVVCLMQEQNRIIWECVMKAQGLKLNPMSLPDFDVLANQSSEGADEATNSVVDQNSLAEVGVQESLLNLGNATNLLTVKPSIESYKNGWFDITNKIKMAAEEFENAFFVIEGIYITIKQYESMANTDETPLTTIIVNSVPIDATEEDIKMAVKPHLLEEARDNIKLQRLSTNGNNWLVQVSPLHSQQLYQLAALVIKEQRCSLFH